MATKSLGTLVKETIMFAKRQAAALAIGAVVFGLLSQGLNSWHRTVVESRLQSITGMGMQQDDKDRVEELTQKAKTGQLTEADQQELTQRMQKMAANFVQAGGLKLLLGSFLSVLGFSVLFALSMIVAQTYFVVVAVKETTDAGSAVKQTLQWFFPVLGLLIWAYLRSFAWIPFVGVITAIVIGPRLLLAPLFLMEQGKGVFESTRLSYQATRGYWGKIFGNGLAVGICLAILLAVVSAVTAQLFGLVVGSFVGVIIGLCLISAAVIFSVRMARTVLENARPANA